MRKLLLLSVLLAGCHKQPVKGNPLTLPTLQHGSGQIINFKDSGESAYSGDVTISEKGWVLVLFSRPFEARTRCNFSDITAKGKLEIKMAEPDGTVLKGPAGHRIHFACQGKLAPPPPPRPAPVGETDRDTM